LSRLFCTSFSIKEFQKRDKRVTKVGVIQKRG